MSDLIRKKIKKYLLYISTVFFVIFWAHLWYIYLFDGAESIPEEWGTISEAIIGGFPHLNPLLPSTDHNGYINSLLYRSMLEYSTISESFESDLVSCNLSNLLYIECILENNVSWSDGTAITTNDIKSTFNIISKTKVNPIIASLLENTTIEITDDSISFSNTKKDINFLHIFLQPILPAKVIEELNSENIEWKFSEINGIYSGRFILSNISQDETVGITKITFGKNAQYFWNPLYINFLIVNLFRDEAHFLKNKNSYNIFNDKDNIIWDTIPRLESYPYTLSQFVWVFFNTEKIDAPFRSYLSEKINRDDFIEQIWENNILPAYNPFLSWKEIDLFDSSYDITQQFNSEKYYSKQDLLDDAISVQAAISANKVDIISQEAAPQETVESESISQENLEFVNFPNSKKYNFVSEDNILVQWRVNSGVTAVYINDYQLTGFSEGDDTFAYRLSTGFETIAEWENSYTVYFETDGVKEEIETFIYIYETDSDELENLESNYFSQTQQIKPKETIQTNNISVKSKLWSSLWISEIEQLDDTYFYNIDGEPKSFRIVYAQTDTYMDTTIKILTDQLAEVGIYSEITAMSLWDITVWLRNETLEYDMMVIGINLWYFSSNIFPYFHSSQIQNGYNIANFKKLSLDILLEELKSNNLSIEKRNELEEKMLDIIKEEAIVKVLYTPNISLLVDKNIKNFSLPWYLPDTKHRSFPLTESYMSEKRIIDIDTKWFLGFLSYIVRNLLSPNSL